MLRRLVSAVVILALLSACGSSNAKTPPPSDATKMVCENQAQSDIAVTIGARPTAAPIPTWKDALYTCVYRYDSAQMVLSVKELTDLPSTDSFFSSTRSRLAGTDTAYAVGEGSFAEPGGSVWVRKDDKVLHVDVSGLPPTFGQPTRPKSAIALVVAGTIMACWTQL